MNAIWIILAVLSFLGGQVYLFFCLGRLDKFLERRSGRKPEPSHDDSCGYPDEDVIE